MEELQKLAQWLLNCPFWQGSLALDDTGPGLGSGLFPMGMQVLHRQEDVLGNRYVRCRNTYQLRQVETLPDTALWLAELARWVQEQSETGNTPSMGNIPGTETVSAANGRLQKRDAGGTATYCIDLIVEYTKVYPAG